MTDHIDKIIKELETEINQLSNDMNIIEKKNQSLPLQINDYVKINQYDSQLKSLNLLSKSIERIDKLKASNDSILSLLDDCLQLFKCKDDSSELSLAIKVKIFNDLMNSQKEKIEEALLVIKFPMFEGFLLRPIIHKMKNDHELEYNILSTYFEIINYIPNQKNQTEFINDQISEVLIKKVIASIFLPFINQTTSISIGDLIEGLKGYLMKAFYNLNELILLITPSEINHSLLMISFINNTFHKLNKSLDKYPIIKSEIESHLIDIIQSISPLNNDLLKIYQYDVFSNESLNTFIRNLTKASLEELITNQKKFCFHLITTTFKDKLRTAIDSSQYNTEDVIDIVKLILKDNINMYTVFKDSRIILDNMLYSSQEIISVFKGFFTNENKKYVTNVNYLFVFNLLFCFMELFGQFRNTFDSRLSILEISFKEEVDKLFILHSKEIFSLIEWYSGSLKQTITFDNLIQLFKPETLSKLTKEKIEDSFKKAEETLTKLYSSFDQVKLLNKVEEFIISNILREFAKNTVNQLDTSLKKGTKGREIELLTAKMREFTYKLLNRDGLSYKIIEELDKQITEINAFLSNLTMYKQ